VRAWGRRDWFSSRHVVLGPLHIQCRLRVSGTFLATANNAAPLSSERVSWHVVAVAAIAALGGLLFGYDTGVISGAILFINKELHLTALAQGLTVSAVTLGALFGALAAGTLADRFGRRTAILVAGVLFALGALVCGLAPTTSIIIAGRLILGLAVGLAAVAAPMYIAEAAPARIRGMLVSLYQLAITLGILLAYIVNHALARSEAWRWMLGLAVIPGIALIFGILPLPDSPRWLIRRNRLDEGREVLRKLRPGADIARELDDIRAELAQETGGTWSDLLAPAFRKALIVGIGLAVFQQVTGINTIIYYAPQIFQSAGFTEATVALAATTGIGVINVLATFIAISLVDRLGRRPLLLAGLVGMTASLALLGLAFRSQSLTSGQFALGWLTLLCLGVYIIFFAFSLGPVVWLMISEIFPNRVRAHAVAVSTAANWAANFLVSLTFPVLIESFGSSRTFWLFAALGVVSFFFILSRVPETKGRSLEQIESLWR